MSRRRTTKCLLGGMLPGIAALGLLAGVLVSSDPASAQKKKATKPAEIRYSHEVHTKRGVDQGVCENCHVLDEKYTVLAPTLGKDHMPCADSECHASEFFSKEPMICVVCHTDARPWIKQKAELKQRRRSDFGGDLSHKTHAGARVGGRGANGACKKCHGNVFGGTPARAGHDDCAPCHEKQSAPAMGECGGCHKLGARKARVKAKTSEWGVAALFAHNTHGKDPTANGAETKCTTCHQTIPTANKLAEIRNPTMRSCDACHDGEAAFKTTGFECYRCHGEKPL